jgi:hypothetical protein
MLSSSCREFYWEDFALIYAVTWAYKFSLCDVSNVRLKMSSDSGTCFFSLIIPHTEDTQGGPNSILYISFVAQKMLRTCSLKLAAVWIHGNEYAESYKCEACPAELACVSQFSEQQVDWPYRNFFGFRNVCGGHSGTVPCNIISFIERIGVAVTF